MAAPRSMTGFAEVSKTEGVLAVRVAIRSVNHRSLDLKLRVPSEAAALETAMRSAVRRVVRRGSLQVTVELLAQGVAEARVDREFIESRLDALREIAKICQQVARPDPHVLLRLPGAFAAEKPSIPADLLERLVLGSLGEALVELQRVRAVEGKALARGIGAHAAAIVAELDRVDGSADEVVALCKARLEARLRDLLDGAGADPLRLAQESALVASRSDVTEELLRLRSHVDALRQCLEGSGEAGKRIDFLGQEMNREVNTMLSKTQALGSAGLWITEAGLRMRAAVEKIREQALNLE